MESFTSEQIEEEKFVMCYECSEKNGNENETSGQEYLTTNVEKDGKILRKKNQKEDFSKSELKEINRFLKAFVSIQKKLSGSLSILPQKNHNASQEELVDISQNETSIKNEQEGDNEACFE